VGDGSQIDIWDGPWIPNSAYGKIITPRGNTMFNKVEDLISPVTGSLDEELVRGIFPIDAKRFLSIPISSYGMDDFVAWRHNKNNLLDQHTMGNGSINLEKKRETYKPRANPWLMESGTHCGRVQLDQKSKILREKAYMVFYLVMEF
jgi:hypothetical protein